jgi:hypothetical protein
MRTICSLLLAVTALAGQTSPLAADDPDKARALLGRAVKAAGGAKNLARNRAIVAEGKGTYYGMGSPLACTADGAVQFPDRKRIELKLDFQGMNVSYVRVVAGSKGWISLQGNTRAMDKEELADAREDVYYDWVTTLAPLRDKAFRLTPLEAIQVDGKGAEGIKVAHKGHGEVRLYFDKESGLLVKGERSVHDKLKGKDVVEESYYSDYKNINGAERPRKRTVKRAGKPFLKVEFTDVKVEEKVDPKTFAEP